MCAECSRTGPGSVVRTYLAISLSAVNGKQETNGQLPLLRNGEVKLRALRFLVMLNPYPSPKYFHLSSLYNENTCTHRDPWPTLHSVQ
jgi:hypothetical protein